MELTFEETMESLEKIVKELESGNLSLDDSIQKYTKGLELSKHAYELLKNAESKLKIEEE